MSANPLSNIPPLGPASGMPPQGGPSRFKPIDPVRLLRQHALLLGVTLIVGIGLGAALWYALRVTQPEFTSEAQLLAKGPISDPNQINPTDVAGRDSMESFIGNELNRIRSQAVLNLVLNRQEVQNTQWFSQFAGQQEALEALQREDFSASPVRGTTLINLEMTTPNEQDAPLILDAIIDVYLFQLENMTTSQYSDLRRVYTDEWRRADNRITELEAQLAEYTRQERVLRGQQSQATVDFNIYAERLSQLRVALEASQAQLAALQKQQGENVPPSADELVTLDQHPGMQYWNQKLRELRDNRGVLIAQYGPQYPAVERTDNQIEIAELQKQIERDRLLAEQRAQAMELAEQNVTSLQAQIASLMPKVEDAERRLADLTNRWARYEQLQAELEQEKLTSREATVGLDKLRRLGSRTDVHRVERQVPPTMAELSFPDARMVIPGVSLLLLGLVTGVIFLRELLDQRIKSPADVKMLSEGNLLGVLPDAREDPAGATVVERVVEQYPTGLLAESFRQVRAALLSRMDRRGYRTLAVVGAQPGAGASTVLQNLGASMAINGRRVLIIDANFRRPSQHRLLDTGCTPGLVDVLAERATLDEALVEIEDMSLSLLPAGACEHAVPEMIDSPAFRDLLAQLETRYDLVLIDAPPTLLTSEAQLLAKHVDAIALVVRASTDKRGMIERSLRQLDGQRADILGVILNAVRSSAGGYFRKSYEQFHEYRRENGQNGPAAPRRRALFGARSE